MFSLTGGFTAASLSQYDPTRRQPMTDYLKTVFFIAAFALLALDCQMNTAPTETLPAKLALGRRSARLSAADSIRSAQPPARTGDPQPVVHQMATGSLNTPDPIGRPRAAAPA